MMLTVEFTDLASRFFWNNGKELRKLTSSEVIYEIDNAPRAVERGNGEGKWRWTW
jgi:hypothetical protein